MYFPIPLVLSLKHVAIITAALTYTLFVNNNMLGHLSVL